MSEQRTGKPRRIFCLEPLRAAHLTEIAGWMEAGPLNDERSQDAQALTDRMDLEFRRQYRPLWHSGEVDTLVMTVNRVAVFCVSLLRMAAPDVTPQTCCTEAHLYMLCRPEVRLSDRLLLLAWQAATVHAFLRMGFSKVQTAVDAHRHEENEALLMLGYRLVETIKGTDGAVSIFACEEKDLRMVM